MRPLSLSFRPATLEAMLKRWPGLKDTTGSLNTTRKVSRALSRSKQLTSSRRVSLSISSQTSEGSVLPVGAIRRKSRELIASQRSSEGGGGMISLVAEEEMLTIELVEYASRPVGAIFRWCGRVLQAALKLVKAATGTLARHPPSPPPFL